MPERENEPRRKRRPGRPQAAPPALLGAGEPFDGFAVLEEWRDGSALVLWQALRDALLWAGAADAAHPALFAPAAWERRARELPAAPLDAALKAPLEALSRVLPPESDVTREEVAAACRQVAAWAEEHGYPRTAIAFAQGAALVLPEDPDHA